jgi:hypothetical protein
MRARSGGGESRGARRAAARSPFPNPWRCPADDATFPLADLPPVSHIPPRAVISPRRPSCPGFRRAPAPGSPWLYQSGKGAGRDRFEHKQTYFALKPHATPSSGKQQTWSSSSGCVAGPVPDENIHELRVNRFEATRAHRSALARLRHDPRNVPGTGSAYLGVAHRRLSMTQARPANFKTPFRCRIPALPAGITASSKSATAGFAQFIRCGASRCR